MINFRPKPKNEFDEFMMMYYEKCRENIPQIQALAAKWNFEDLIPGLSDYDTRFIYSDMTVDDWCRASMAIGDVHLDICNKYPRWARILEHLPGINITWSEYMDEKLYYPEFHQWTIYRSENPVELKRSQDYLANHKWDQRDEMFFLKKFLTYYSPYDRKIDPPINLKEYENKYPLHSRFMHYFVPPMQAAVCIIEKKVICGKLDSVLAAKKIFPELDIFDELLDVVERHYEALELYEEPEITKLDKRLYDALTVISRKLSNHLTVIDGAEHKKPFEWKQDVSSSSEPSFLTVFDNTKWARQMRGRLHFYANSPEHFDSQLCIGVELNRINRMFFVVPYTVYGELNSGSSHTDLLQVVRNLSGHLLTANQANATIKFHELTSQTHQPCDYKKAALDIVDVYDDFYRGLYRLTEKINEILHKGCEK